MQTRSSRSVNSVSGDEMQRRWAAVRGAMRARRIDALVVQNSSDWVGGYIRWFSNQPATNGYPSTLVSPLDGVLAFIEQGPLRGMRRSGEAEIEPTGIGRRLGTPSYLGPGYTGGFGADLALI